MPHDPNEKAAWDVYLEETRGLENVRYNEIEPWAWAKLKKELQRIRQSAKKAVA